MSRESFRAWVGCATSIPGAAPAQRPASINRRKEVATTRENRQHHNDRNHGPPSHTPLSFHYVRPLLPVYCSCRRSIFSLRLIQSAFLYNLRNVLIERPPPPEHSGACMHSYLRLNGTWAASPLIRRSSRTN